MSRSRKATLNERQAPLAASRPILASKLRLLGVAVLCAKVVLVPLVFDHSADVPFTVPKALISHGLAYVLAAIIAGLFIQFGVAFLVRSWLHVAVLAFLVISVVSAMVGVESRLALYGTHARMLGLGSIVDCIITYFAIVLLIRTRADAYAVVTCALAASSLVLGYELIQVLGKDPFRWTLDGSERPFSTLGHGTVLAQYLTVLALGAFALGILVDRMRPLARMVVVAYSVLLLVGSAATATRSALLGVGAGSVMLVLLVWRFHPNPRARPVALVGAVCATAALGLVLFATPLGARIATTIENPPLEGDDDLLARLEPSAAGRLVFYGIGADIVRERPLLGYGPDNFVVGVPRYRPAAAPEVIRQNLATSPHSWVVQVATSSGLSGLVCFVAIALLAFGLALRGGFRPASLAGTVMLATFLGTGLATVNELSTDWLFWAGAGAVAAATAHDPSSERVGPRRSGTQSRGARRHSVVPLVASGLLLTAAVFAAFAGTNALDASRAARASQESRFGGQPASAVENGLNATRSDPGRAEYWHILGLAYVATTRWSDAIGAFDRAITLAPYDARYIGDLASALLVRVGMGDQAARSRARKVGELVVRVDRNNPQAHLTRAVVMEVLGDLPEAVRSVERAFELDPSSMNEQLYVTAVKVMMDSGRPLDAVRVGRLGLGLFGRTNRAIELRIELARALVTTGQPLDALTELDRALAIEPNNPTAERLRAQIRAALPK